jgi:hypothetical protein
MLLSELLVHQVDTKSVFLNCNLGEEVYKYMKLPSDDQRDLRDVDDLKKKFNGTIKDLKEINNFVGLEEKKDMKKEIVSISQKSRGDQGDCEEVWNVGLAVARTHWFTWKCNTWKLCQDNSMIFERNQ